METFMNMMKKTTAINAIIADVRFSNGTGGYTGADCLQPMANNIDELNKKE